MPANRLEIRFLSDEALDRIKETVYRLLNEVGISLQHAGATDIPTYCTVGDAGSRTS